MTKEEIEDSISKIEYVIDDAIGKLEDQQKNIYLLVEAFKGKLESSIESIEILRNAALELKREKNDVLVPQKEYRSLVAAVESLEGKILSSLGQTVKSSDNSSKTTVQNRSKEKTYSHEETKNTDLTYLEESVEYIKEKMIVSAALCNKKIFFGFIIVGVLILMDIATRFI